MQQARENAATAPALLENVETATFSAAEAMQQAMSAASVDEVGKAATNAQAAVDTAKQTAAKLNHISTKVKEYALTDLYEAVESHQKAADNAVRTAEQCVAQADRLATLSKARQAAAQRQQNLQDAQALLGAEKQRVQIAAEQLAQLEGIQKTLETRAVESKGEAFADERKQAASQVLAAKQSQQEATQQLANAEERVRQQQEQSKPSPQTSRPQKWLLALQRRGLQASRRSCSSLRLYAAWQAISRPSPGYWHLYVSTTTSST
jgi:chromosome segregation ATPase